MESTRLVCIGRPHGAAGQATRVQVGDPFTEKLLLEASLELIRAGTLSPQDMGAVDDIVIGEMAARGDVGVTIDVTKVPLREPGMTPYEICSRVAGADARGPHRGREDRVREILAKWDLSAEVIARSCGPVVPRDGRRSRGREFPGRGSSPTARCIRPSAGE